MSKLRRYAENTPVPVVRTKSEIETLLRKHGASAFMSGETSAGATFMFKLGQHGVRFDIPFPTDNSIKSAEAEYRRRWRVLLMRIKMRLETVAGGDATFEEEFLAAIVVDGSRCLIDVLKPQLQSGKLPQLNILGPGQ